MLSTLQFLQETLWLQFCGTCWLVTTLDAISTPGALSLLKAQSQLGSSEHQGKQRTSPPQAHMLQAHECSPSSEDWCHLSATQPPSPGLGLTHSRNSWGVRS